MTNLSERLERLGKRLMASTEFGKYAHMVMEASVVLDVLVSHERHEHLPKFASILRQIKERGEDPYCGFEEVLCEIVHQLIRARATSIAMREHAMLARNWGDTVMLVPLEVAEEAVRSARAAIIEECAEVCDEQEQKWSRHRTEDNTSAAHHAAEAYALGRAIRALASTAKKEER